MFRRMILCVLLVVSSFMLSSCRSGGEVSSYLLLPDAKLSASVLSSGTKSESCHLTGVHMPDYLRRRELVRLVGGDRVEGIPRARWAVDLERMAQSVLDENLRQLLGDRYGSLGSPARSLVLRFRHFELDDENRLQVRGTCAESGAHGRRLDIAFELDGSSYANPARVHSAALSRIAVLVADWLCK